MANNMNNIYVTTGLKRRTYNLGGNYDDIYSNVTDQEIGKISKQWTGLAKEWFTNADNFGINWPMDLDVNLKATLIGALFLIDFMAFEQQNNQ